MMIQNMRLIFSPSELLLRILIRSYYLFSTSPNNDVACARCGIRGPLYIDRCLYCASLEFPDEKKVSNRR